MSVKFRVLVFSICSTLLAHCGSYAYQCGDQIPAKSFPLTNYTGAPRTCVYHIKPYSGFVRQLKIVFSLHLAQPTFYRSNYTATPECKDEYLEIGDLVFCGVEQYQHVYIPFDSAKNGTDVTIELSERAPNSSLSKPYWFLLISQVESAPLCNGMPPELCPGPNPALAPSGCLQYFSAKRGVIKSFNYNAKPSIYLADLKYTICIRRPSEEYYLRLSFYDFDLRRDDRNLGPVESDYPYCQGLHWEDYLMIPQSAIIPANSSNLRDNFFCGNSLKNKEVISNSSDTGYFRMIFEPRSFSEHYNTGFRIQYQLVSSNKSNAEI